MFTVTYWVLAVNTDETIAMCSDKNAAEWIATNFPRECVVRYTISKIG